MPDDRRLLCLPTEAWPQQDRLAWQAAQHRGGLLDDDGLAISWSTATLTIIARGYGRFLSFLHATGELDLLAGPAERITRARVEAYVAHLRERNHSSTVAARLREVSRAIAVMAPQFDRSWLLRIVARLRRSAHPARDDRPRLPVGDTIPRLAVELMTRAEIGRNPSARHAVLYRDGLMLAILYVCPVRARSMAALALGTTLQRRTGEWWLVLGSGETKNKRPFEAPLPGLTQALDSYIERFRPLLLSRSREPAGLDALWISDGGKPLSAKLVGQLVTRRTERELGIPFNPHLFRKLAATNLAVHDPAHAGVAQPLLGHADYRTTEQTYNLAQGLDSARRHQALIRSLRDGASD